MQGSHDVVWSQEWEDWFNVVEQFQIATAFMSCAGSGLVLLTGLCFYREMVSKKIYMWMILSMSFSDFCASCAAAMGFPQPGPTCIVQAGMAVFFTRASWMWCFAICATLYTQLTRRRIYLGIKSVSCLIWGLNLFLQFIPFAARGKQQYGTGTSTKMAFASRQGKMMCSLMSKSNPDLWRIVAIEAPMIIILVAMFALWIMLIRRLEPMPAPEDDPTGAKAELVKRVRKVIKNILFYPASMFLSWTPQAVVFFAYVSLEADASQERTNRFFFSSVLSRAFGFTFGIFLALVFFIRSEESQVRWYELLKTVGTETGVWWCLFGGHDPSNTSGLEGEYMTGEGGWGADADADPDSGRIPGAQSTFRPTRLTADCPIREGSKSTTSVSTRSSSSKSWLGSFSISFSSQNTGVKSAMSGSSGGSTASSRRASRRASRSVTFTSDFEQDDHISRTIAEHHSAKTGTNTRLQTLSEVGAGGVGARGTRNDTISEESGGLSTIMSGTLSATTLDISLQPDDIPRSTGFRWSQQEEQMEMGRGSTITPNPLYSTEEGVEMNGV